MKQLILCLASGVLLISCYHKPKIKSALQADAKKQNVKHDAILISKDTVNSADYVFYSESLLHGHCDALRYYFKKYTPDTCGRFHLLKSDLIKNFEGIRFIGDINHNGIPDSVFVLEPISYCNIEGEDDWNGDAYYFTDTTLPRLQTNSGCCHPSSLFLVGDIDEDGVSEIGQYYSSCASHYKSLHVFTLKNNHWKEIGKSVYDLFLMDINKPFSSWVRKTGKNKFEMLQITDLTDNDKIGKKEWLKFTMK